MKNLKKILGLGILAVVILSSASNAYALGAYDWRSIFRNSTNTANVNIDVPIPAGGANGLIGVKGSTSLPEMFLFGSTIVPNGSNIINAVLGVADVTGLQTALDVKFAIPAGTTSQYVRGDGTLNTFPSIPAAQIQSDWTQASTGALDYIKNKPSLATVATTGAYSDLTGKPSLATVATSGSYNDLINKPTIPSGTVTSVGVSVPSAFNVSGSPVTSSGTIAITGAGSTSQYVRGDGSLAAFPSIPSGTVTSVGLSSSDFSVSGSPITTSGSITANLNTVVTAGTYSAVTTDSKGRVTAGTNRSQGSASRTLNSCFQVSSIKDALVNYSVDIAATLSLSGGQTGTAFLEIYSDSGCTTGTQELARSVNGNTGTLTIGLNITQNVTGGLNGYVPAGSYVKIRTANTTGSPSFTYRSGQEVQL